VEVSKFVFSTQSTSTAISGQQLWRCQPQKLFTATSDIFSIWQHCFQSAQEMNMPATLRGEKHILKLKLEIPLTLNSHRQDFLLALLQLQRGGKEVAF